MRLVFVVVVAFLLFPVAAKAQDPVDTSEECSLCGDVYAFATGICGSYLIGGPSGEVMASICMATATDQYIQCVERYCGSAAFAGWFPNWFIDWMLSEDQTDEGGEYIPLEEEM